MEIEVHERESPRARDEFMSVVVIRADALRDGAIKGAPCLCHEPLVRRNEKSAGTGGRVADREVPGDARVRLHAADD